MRKIVLSSQNNYMSSNRTKKSIINIIAAVSGQSLGIVVACATRIVFVKQLGEVYLGISGLFTSIVGLLSLAELGVGEAINYKLYKPLAEQDIEKVNSLMQFYMKVYRMIGISILMIGIIMMPFLRFFLKSSDVSMVNNLYFIFALFLINTACSYFYSYKRALLISDQRRYVVTIYHYTFYCLMNIGQIIVLLYMKNFVWYLIIMLVCTIFQNILISRKADKDYPYLASKNIEKIANIDLNEIKKNTLALMFHKIGSVVVNSTDNILASKMIGIVIVGIYSNYLLITSALNTIIAQLFAAVTASVGNLGVSVGQKESEGVLKKMLFGNFWITAIVCSGFYAIIDKVISEWFGSDMILDKKVLICITINLFLYNIRRTAWTFRDAYGLFWYDRYKAIVEAIINLGLSIILGAKMGLVGILVGTIASTVLTSLWIEPLVLYKYAFEKSSIQYFQQLLVYSIITFMCCWICEIVVSYNRIDGMLGIIVDGIICVLMTSGIVLILNLKKEECIYYLCLGNRIIKKSKYQLF